MVGPLAPGQAYCPVAGGGPGGALPVPMTTGGFLSGNAMPIALGFGAALILAIALGGRR